MKISKIITYAVLAIGVIGAILWYVMGSSIDVLMDQYAITDAKDLVKDQDASAFSEAIATVGPMYTLTLIIFVITVIATLISVFSTLAKNPSGLKNVLIGVVAFLVVAGIGYVLAEGVETPMKDGEVLSEGGSKLVGAGLYTFYFLAAIAVLMMFTSGIKKIIGK
ncbi:hypothetical protein [Aquimarina sp. MMG016]|uniref:hypothetical protein n=1 Tax=Aquimarina sp. MMG016 TaxID=2822690 RepID=UPI001B3A4FC3|nr:hypothetical protein [Aquimarina sp. MMG016]MBQ4818766.1 hypothetical protein [Aquimarina sp. MMG016]